MRRLLFLLLACLAGVVGGCNIMPEEDPGYYVRNGRMGAGAQGRRGADRSTPPTTDPGQT